MIPPVSVYVDARELEAPEPLQQALLALQGLKEDEHLFLVHRRMPTPLLELVAKLGYHYDTDQSEEDRYHVRIWKEHP